MSEFVPSAAQAQAIKSIVEWYKSGRQEFYLAGYAGVGKSTVAAHAIEELKSRCKVKRVRTAAYTGKAASVLRKKGVEDAQTIHSLIYSPIEDEETGEVHFVVSEDSPAADADLIVLDECFSRDTLVDTPSGQVYICDIRPGDAIFNAWGVDNIVATMKKEAKDAVQINIGGKAVTCSANHRFFTARGLVNAIDLRPGDALVEVAQAVRLLQSGVLSEELGGEVLQRELREALVAPVSFIPREDIHAGSQQEVRRCEKSLASIRRPQSKTRNRADSLVEPGNEPEHAGQDQRSPQSEGPSASLAGRQWKRVDEASGATSEPSRPELDCGALDLAGASAERQADALQDRLSQSQSEDRDRTGRWLAPVGLVQKAGFSKDRVAEAVRVESVEVLELGDPRLDHLRDADGKLYLYDLQAARHSSFAVNGVLVHNCSMVDKAIAADLRSFGKKILVMGDPGQLPPINGEGDFTSREPDVFLHEIHRQAADSPIIELARQGKPLPRGYDKGGVRVLQLTKETQPLIYRPETQPICGLNRVRWIYNQRIRKLRGFDGEVPQVGERVICCRNNREEGLFNGGMGTLRRLETEHDGWPDTYLIDVDMDDLGKPCRDLMVDPYLFRRNFTNGVGMKLEMPRGRRLDEFDLGYLLTAHKAQGSSWEDVTVIDDSGCFKENRHKWLYTSLTRSEKSLTVLLRA